MTEQQGWIVIGMLFGIASQNADTQFSRLVYFSGGLMAFAMAVFYPFLGKI